MGADQDVACALEECANSLDLAAVVAARKDGR